uniref:N-acyl-aromatic-L-amino acid amidohydrolase (carboxylate-forming)-like n=1 Tax=Pristiophorus japonicus TaxID=55135 RepID=UPI00398EF2A0
MTCDPAVTYALLRRVAVVVGTHGNEMSGVFLTRHWLKDPAELQRQTFSTTPLLANPPAVEKCIRYLDRDLNRCFLPDMLSAESNQPLTYEVLRAKELNRVLGPRGSERATDLIIDLHNTTANMGDCLMINNTRCRVLALELSVDGLYDLTSVSKHDLVEALQLQQLTPAVSGKSWIPAGKSRSAYLTATKAQVDQASVYRYPSNNREIREVLCLQNEAKNPGEITWGG